MPRRRLCKFFADGACLKGENCEFSHDWKAPSNNVKICSHYQKGPCYYGSRCKYAHVKPSRPQSASSSSSMMYRRKSPVSSPVPQPHSAIAGLNEVTLVPGGSSKVSDSNRLFTSSAKHALHMKLGEHDLFENGDVLDSRNDKPEDRSMCSLAADGNCPRGESCPFIHGDLCPTCGKHCLHPFELGQREEHLKSCEKKQKHIEALKLSQEIECSVCLDKVLSKPKASERKFGILPECNHSFCISCIKNWRSSSPASGMDDNTAVKACPVCRKTSHFVVPSVSWYSSKDEKQEIIDNYKAKLRSIDCKHFNFGNGNCQFGTSCFYRHHVKPGSYMWKHNKPPPVRRAPRRSNVNDVEYMHYILEQLFEDDEPAFLDYDDFTDVNHYNEDFTEELSPFDMAFMFSMLDCGPPDESSDEEYPF